MRKCGSSNFRLQRSVREQISRKSSNIFLFVVDFIDCQNAVDSVEIQRCHDTRRRVAHSVVTHGASQRCSALVDQLTSTLTVQVAAAEVFAIIVVAVAIACLFCFSVDFWQLIRGHNAPGGRDAKHLINMQASGAHIDSSACNDAYPYIVCVSRSLNRNYTHALCAFDLHKFKRKPRVATVTTLGM